MGNQETIDTAKFTHSGTSNAHQVTVDTDGDYLLLYSDALTSASRANPKMVVRVNGIDILGTEVASHYIRNEVGTITHPVPCYGFKWFEEQ